MDDNVLPGAPYILGAAAMAAYDGIDGANGMLSGGGFEYMLILVASAVVRRPDGRTSG